MQRKVKKPTNIARRRPKPQKTKAVIPVIPVTVQHPRKMVATSATKSGTTRWPLPTKLSGRRSKVGRPRRHGQGRATGRQARRLVLSGRWGQTVGRLKSGDLMINRKGKIVSRKASEAAKKRSGAMMHRWGRAVKLAREALGITGFVTVGGSTVAGKALYKMTKFHYDGLVERAVG